MANPKPNQLVAPPVPKRPPKSLNAGSAFDQYIKAHPKLQPYASLIWKWSKQYGVAPAVLASLINFESGGNPGARSKKNAFGLAQIHLPTWAGKKTPWGETITEAWAANPNNAVRFAAWYFSTQIAKYGDPDSAYRRGYNPGYTGAGPFKDLPKGYVPRAGLNPSEQVSAEIEKAGIKQDLTDPYVRLNKKGQLVKTQNPNQAIKSFGQPVRMSDFRRYQSQLNDNYQAYLGRNATPAEAANVLRKGWSEYKLINELTKQPGFQNSPIWKSRAPAYEAVAGELVGTAKPEWIREAIVNNWDSNTFAATLRKKPEYLKSKEFAGLYTSMEGVYRKIMGAPGENEKALTKEVTLAGWTAEQYAGWLRSQDAYKYSPEGLARTASFLSDLGMVFGAMPVLKSGGAAVKQTKADVPDDTRTSAPLLTPGATPMTAGYGG